MNRIELKIRRVAKKMTQQQVAEKMGVSVATYSFIESGKRSGSIENWAKIRELFGLTDEEAWKLMQGE